MLVPKEDIITVLIKNNYKFTNYNLGIKVHMNDNQYIDISRADNNMLYLDVYTNNKLDRKSTNILDDRSLIRFTSLIMVLNDVSNKLNNN